MKVLTLFFRELCRFLKGGTCSFRIYIYIYTLIFAGTHVYIIYIYIYLSVLVYTYTIALYEFQPAQKTIKLVFWSSQFLRQNANSNSASNLFQRMNLQQQQPQEISKFPLPQAFDLVFFSF